MGGSLEGRSGGGFRWNAGGWFGGQLGATLWMGLLGVLTLPRHPVAGAAVLGLALAANGVGVALWRRRASLAAYPAVQLLIAVCGVAALGSVLVLRAAGSVHSSQVWLAPLAYPVLMLFLHLLQRGPVGGRSRG